MNNYDKIYIAGDFNYPSVRLDVEWSNNKDNEFVECFRDVFLTKTVKKKKKKKKNVKRERHTFNLQGCFTCTRTAGDGEQRAKFVSVSLIPVNT